MPGDAGYIPGDIGLTSRCDGCVDGCVMIYGCVCPAGVCFVEDTGEECGYVLESSDSDSCDE
jgi:hypothetical protein